MHGIHERRVVDAEQVWAALGEVLDVAIRIGQRRYVSVDDSGDEEDNTCRWVVNDWDEGLKCKRPDCEECAGAD